MDESSWHSARSRVAILCFGILEIGRLARFDVLYQKRVSAIGHRKIGPPLLSPIISNILKIYIWLTQSLVCNACVALVHSYFWLRERTTHRQSSQYKPCKIYSFESKREKWDILHPPGNAYFTLIVTINDATMLVLYDVTNLVDSTTRPSESDVMSSKICMEKERRTTRHRAVLTLKKPVDVFDMRHQLL